MYKLVHTHIKLEIAYALNYETYIFYVSVQYQVCSKSKERYHYSRNPQRKNKTRHKIKYYCLFENFQCFCFLFLNKQNNLRK